MIDRAALARLTQAELDRFADTHPLSRELFARAQRSLLGELSRRFGVGRWLFTLSATDANRTALRIARQVTGRAKVLVFSYCYHQSRGHWGSAALRRRRCWRR
jgi:glutamate-1-semialdehyde 2,1-aminomutase